MISRYLFKTQLLKQSHACHTRCLQTRANSSVQNKDLKRTHYCGQVGTQHAGHEITVCGWLQTKRYSNFIILRDRYGTLQVCLDEEFFKKHPEFSVENITNESVLAINGTVRPRPVSQINTSMNTGHIEVAANEVQVLNLAKDKLPFTISEHNRANEAVRMKYRYLDLRFDEMQQNLRMRSKFVNNCRQYLSVHGFVDVETPTLFRRTPGGAREFIVPTKQSEQFYCLTQSPQQFKQLLMVAGIDKYYQVARCYRDEATKPDRQPEFTQLDIEQSFVDDKDIQSLIEGLLTTSWPFKPELIAPFRRMKFSDAMRSYGNDKPDLRFDMRFSEVGSLLMHGDSGVKKLDAMRDAGFKAFAFKIDSESGLRDAIGFKKIEREFQQLCKNAFASYSAGAFEKENLVFMAFESNGDGGTNISKYMTPETKSSLSSELSAKTGDTIVLLAWSNEPKLLEVLGKLRINLADAIDAHSLTKDPGSKLLRDPKKFEFLWVTDFPLFSRDEVTNKLESTHHPFTAPIKEHEQLVQELRDLDSVVGLHYDLVLNGEEIAGGSIRIHDGKFQKHLLENVLNENTEQLTHLLEAFEYGAPPHGGIALGLDRLVALMCGTENIRNVIAFPKAQSGKDVMSAAPARVPQAELDYYKIKCVTDS